MGEEERGRKGGGRGEGEKGGRREKGGRGEGERKREGKIERKGGVREIRLKVLLHFTFGCVL